MFWSSVSIILVGQLTLYCFIPLLYFIDSTYSHNEIKLLSLDNKCQCFIYLFLLWLDINC